MKTNNRSIDRSVNIWSEIPAPTRGYIPSVLVSTAEKLKAALVKKFAAEHPCVPPRLVFQSINEAHAMAMLTHIPLLVLPELAREKVDQTANWYCRQEELLQGGMRAFAA